MTLQEVPVPGPRLGADAVGLGEPVGNAWSWSACGACPFCRTGRETLCGSRCEGGCPVDGSLGRHVLDDAEFAARTPRGAHPVAVAPVLCAGVTVHQGLEMAHARSGGWVTTSGIGGPGHIAVQDAVARGSHVAAVDVDDAELDPVRRHGAEVTVNSREQDPASVVRAATGGTDGVLVAAVHPSASGQALGAARRGADHRGRRPPAPHRAWSDRRTHRPRPDRAERESTCLSD